VTQCGGQELTLLAANNGRSLVTDALN